MHVLAQFEPLTITTLPTCSEPPRTFPLSFGFSLGFSQVGKGYAYSAASSTTKVEFDFFMGLLNDVAPEAHEKLEAIPHELWAYYAGQKNVCWGQRTTNPSESANNLLLEVRYSP